MRDLHEALRQSGETGAQPIARILRDGAFQERLLESGRARRRRRVTAQSVAAAVAAVVLAATVVWSLPAILDSEPAVDVVRVGDVARIDPGARDALQCGAVPSGLPQQGTTVASDDLDPQVSVTVATRPADAPTGTGDATPVDVAGAVPVDPARTLVFGLDMAWGDSELPDDWRVITAGAVLDAQGRVVMTHRGETVRSDIAAPTEGLRPLEGSFDAYECGDGARITPSGSHTLVLVAQVAAGDQVIATFVNAGIPADARLTFAPGSLAGAGQSGPVGATELHERQLHQVERDGTGLAEARIGYRPAPVADGSHAPFRACADIALARQGLDQLAVMPWHTMPEGLEVGLAPPDDERLDERVIAFSAPVDFPDPSWLRSQREAVLMLIGQDGELVAAFEASPNVHGSRDDDGQAWGARSFTRGAECGVPGELPTAPGSYTAVISVVASELPGAPGEPLPLANDLYRLELWVVLPDLIVREDGTVAELSWLAEALDN